MKNKLKAIRKQSVYFPKGEKTGCGGHDCSWQKLKPCAKQKLISIVPAPPPADVARVTLDANIELRNQLADMLKALNTLAKAGEPFALLVHKVLHGFGGQEICDLYSKDCECEHEKGTPPEVWTGPPLIWPVKVTFKGVTYTANFELRAELQILHGRCDDSF